MSSVQIRDVRKSFGGFEVLHGVSIPIEDGALARRRTKACRAPGVPHALCFWAEGSLRNSGTWCRGNAGLCSDSS